MNWMVWMNGGMNWIDRWMVGIDECKNRMV